MSAQLTTPAEVWPCLDQLVKELQGDAETALELAKKAELEKAHLEVQVDYYRKQMMFFRERKRELQEALDEQIEDNRLLRDKLGKAAEAIKGYSGETDDRLGRVLTGMAALKAQTVAKERNDEGSDV